VGLLLRTGFLDASVSPPQISSSRGNACVVGRDGLKDAGVSKRFVHRGTQCARIGLI
jgi:hypothetical protein